MTVKEFLVEHQTEQCNFMTPSGYLNLTAQDTQRLLQGHPAKTHLGCCGSTQEIASEEILKQEFVDEPQLDDGTWYAMTQQPVHIPIHIPAMDMKLY